jgi:uncharacterized membrane protein
MDNSSTNDTGRTAGIISYFTLLGWLIAYFAFHQKDKTELGSYQLRQTLLFHIVFMVVSGVAGFIIGLIFSSGSLAGDIGWIINVGFFVLWIIGFIGVANGQKKPIPLLGERAQDMFSGI